MCIVRFQTQENISFDGWYKISYKVHSAVYIKFQVTENNYEYNKYLQCQNFKEFLVGEIFYYTRITNIGVWTAGLHI